MEKEKLRSDIDGCFKWDADTLVDNFEEVFCKTKKNFDESLQMKKIGSKLNSFLKREKKQS